MQIISGKNSAWVVGRRLRSFCFCFCWMTLAMCYKVYWSGFVSFPFSSLPARTWTWTCLHSANLYLQQSQTSCCAPPPRASSAPSYPWSASEVPWLPATACAGPGPTWGQSCDEAVDCYWGKACWMVKWLLVSRTIQRSTFDPVQIFLVPLELLESALRRAFAVHSFIYNQSIIPAATASSQMVGSFFCWLWCWMVVVFL